MNPKDIITILLTFATLVFFIDNIFYRLTSINNTEPFRRPKIYRWASDYNTTLVRESLKKFNLTLENLRDRPKFWTDNIQLCIQFNILHVIQDQKQLELLASYYYPFFKNIKFFYDGEQGTVANSSLSFVDIMRCDSHLGWYQHKCIQQCINEGTDTTKGYMYISDDMFINITAMADLPISKIWFTTIVAKNYTWIQNPGPNGWGWMWFGPPYDNAKKLVKVIDSLPISWIRNLTTNAGFPDNNFEAIATSDIIYIPQNKVAKMNLVLDHIIKTEDLFCEITTALAVNIITSDEIDLGLGYLWGDRSVEAIRRAAEIAYFVHPVKLGIPEYREVWVEYMEKQLQDVATH